MNNYTRNKMEEKMEHILEHGECWTIDFFPKQISSIEKIEGIEQYLLRPKNRKIYAKKMINIILKIMAYYDVEIWVEKTKKKSIKKYSDNFLPSNMEVNKLADIIEKTVISDGTINVLVNSLSMVIEVQLFNTGVYFEKYREDFRLKKIIESEGFFFWKVPEK